VSARDLGRLRLARLARSALVIAFLLVVRWVRAEPTERSPRLRTSLVWIFGDDDVLHAPGATSPPSPGVGMGDRLGFGSLAEGQSSRFTGRENRSELELDAVAPGFLPVVSTRARLALGLDASSLGVRGAPVVLEDTGSFLEASWSFGSAGPRRRDALSLQAFPLNGDRERVGQLELLGWGGAVGPRWESPYASARGPVRAGRLELALGFALAHVGLKTAPFLEPTPAGPAVEETSYGYYGGVASRWSAPVGVALSFGHFEQGRLPGGVEAPRATTTGVSLALRAGVGFSEPRAPEGLGLERSPFDADVTHDADEPYGAGESRRGVALGLEATHIVQRLGDFERPGASALASGRALAALAEARWDALDARALFTLREPEFVMRNAPGVFPSQTTPRGMARQNELALFASVALTLGPVRPSLSAAVLWPAAVTTAGIDAFGQVTGATLLLRGPGDVESLPPAEGSTPIVEARPGLSLRVSTLLEAFAWGQYRRDFNRTRLVASPSGALARGYQSPDHLGYGVALRATW
jgi:hypothetical protein